MFQPPIELLLCPEHPSQTSHVNLDLFPLLITSPSVASVLLFLLNYHRLHKPRENSILVICSSSRQHSINNALQNDINAEGSVISSFLSSLETASSIWQAASRQLSIVHVTSLPQLSAFLSIVRMEQKTFLAIWGFTEMHRLGERYSAQGLGRTLASALDACNNGRLIIGDSKSEDEFIGILNETEFLGESQAIGIDKCYARWMKSFWTVGVGEGEWSSMGHKSLVQWKEQENKCIDITITNKPL
ncbi:hypothetical protein NEOLI_001643 [Neolecta irregularis DAH-3]|uniref:Uncharacterized protein n=1 Tax=Neolecta irregularis (strain DAH-3) TaxID=1198029 RepID=A0A1U7LSX0_NEOID|nr:hypothetical protein NEOLI_001643 [Neolecta irregularis DAH-3]|eukprot:OLL25744.1 hypothetical protein NEOLI_001643 [Neolecta irregularis DAH-3]